MKNEADFKRFFKKNVIRQKGMCIQLAAPVFNGIPDLYVCIPGYLPVLMEAKYLGEIKREKFTRKLPFTPMQVEWIRNCDEVCSYSAMGLIGFKYGLENKLHCALVKYGTPLFYSFNSTFLIDCAYVVESTNKHLDILELFAKVPIPKMQTKLGSTLINHDTLVPQGKMAASS